MHPHLSAIGFVAEDMEGIPALADLAAQASTPVEVRGGYCYLHWAGKSGAEMWLQLSRDSKLTGLMPHFAGPSRVRVALLEVIQREDASELDQAYYAWAEPVPGEENRTFPFVFDCPNPRVHSDLPCPTVATVQLTAFPFDITLYPTVEAFEAEREDEGGGLGEDEGKGEEVPELTSFHSIGLAASDGTSLRTAEALAMITGVVKETATHRNELTGESFHWALIECMNTPLDVVIDPRTVPEAPQVGGVVTGLFSLSGRFIAYEKARGFFDRSRGVT